MDWLMRLAFNETCECCDVATWDFKWWVAWREQHVQVYFNLPRCDHCAVAIDHINSVGNKGGLYRPCSKL